MRQIIFYRTAGGACPVEEYLDGLGSKQVEKILWVIRAVKELPRVPEQYFKKLRGTEELWEIRAEFGGDAFRLLGFWDGGSFIVLTNGFSKKTQKTPEREIALAEQRRRDHLLRKKRS